MPLFRLWIVLGALNGALAVAAAAYTAHAPVEPARLRALSSAVQMQGWHALALVATGLLAAHAATAPAPTTWPTTLAALLFLVGTALFCAAVWLPQFGGPSLGMTAPVGGTMLILAWLALALAAARA